MNYSQFIVKTMEGRKNMKNIDKMKFFEGMQEEVSQTERTVRAFITTEDKDRTGDIVRATGLDVTNYRKNPIVLADHDYNKPIGKNLQLSVKQRENGVFGILALTEFAPTAAAIERFWLHKEGFLNAWSVGILCKEWEVMDDEGWDIKKSELYEYSSVPIPANPEALDVEKLFSTDVLTRQEKMGFLKNASIELYIKTLEKENVDMYKELGKLKEILLKMKLVSNETKEVGFAGTSLSKKDIDFLFDRIIK